MSVSEKNHQYYTIHYILYTVHILLTHLVYNNCPKNMSKLPARQSFIQSVSQLGAIHLYLKKH